MFKSIFSKQFTLYFGTLALCFSIMGIALSQGFRGYFTNQKIEALTAQCERLASLYGQTYGTNNYGVINLSQYRRLVDELSMLNEYLDVSVLFINKNITITSASEDIKTNVLDKTLESEEFQKLINGEKIVIQGKLEDIYSVPMLTLGYPIMENGVLLGAILMNTPLPDLQRSISDVFRITVLCIGLAGFIAFVLIYFSIQSICKPLRQMNHAAKVIAGGNFEKRIAVSSQDEVGQLADSFNNMADSLNRQEKMRNEFITNISHDLRSPLTSMRGFLQAIADGTVPEEKQGYYLGIVLDETERLSKLANDLLDLNKIQSFETMLYKSEFDINELIRKTLSGFETQITGKRLNVTASYADEKNIVYADYDKIQRVMYNLLHNAVKFTPEDGDISVETNVSDGKIFISVKDNGIGLNKEDQKMIFERFFKADTSRGEDRRGSGLGLSIVKEFIKAHDETITLLSEPGKGCCFTFGLPVIQPE